MFFRARLLGCRAMSVVLADELQVDESQGNSSFAARLFARSCWLLGFQVRRFAFRTYLFGFVMQEGTPEARHFFIQFYLIVGRN